MDLLLPNVRLAKITPRLMDNVGRFAGPMSGAYKTYARPGDRWGFRLDYSNLQNFDRARLEAFLANLRGAANRALYTPGDFVQRGTWTRTELANNGLFSNGSTGWTSSGATLVVADNMARVENPTAAASSIVSSAITTVSGQSYVARVISFPGSTQNWEVLGGTTAGASNVFSSSALTAAGLFEQAFTASATSLYITLFCNSAVSGDFIHYVYVSVTQVPLVNGANQTGSSLAISGLPATTNGMLLPGDWIEISQELKKVTAPLRSNGSGLATLQFSPPLRNSPTNGSSIINVNPMGRFIVSSTEASWAAVPAYFATSSIDLIEAPIT